jgi:hypothetical protein
MKLKNYYMKKENNENLITKKVISKIEKGELKMKPRFYFVAKSFLVIGLLTLASLFLLYFGSLIVFILRVNNILLFHGMGFQVIRNILLAFPWYLVFLILILIIVIETIGKRFRFIYRKPLIVSLSAILFIVVASSFLIESSSLHHSFYRLAEQERLPLAGRMYRELGNLDIEDTHFGIILEKKNDFWIMELDSGEAVKLKITEKTRGRRTFLETEEEEKVIVVGEMKEGVIDVDSFKKIERRFRHYNQRLNER